LTKLEEKIENLVKPIIEDLGYNLFDVVYVKEAKDYYLRIFIDSEAGISLEDCEKVSNAINDILDEKDLSLDSWAEILGTINYELTCRLKVRLPRVYTR